MSGPNLTKETWGQPPISVYVMETDGENLMATELDDYYGELAYSHYIDISEVYQMIKEDSEDIALCQSRSEEPTVDWQDIKRELSEDGLL
jgi:hypothetical protein